MWWWSSAAFAASVYVNGVNVDGLRNQTFQNATVTIDANGNVQITAPGYRIEVQGAAPAAPPAAPTTAVPSDHYWLVTEDNGSQGHSIAILVNGVAVQTVRSGEAQKIVDLTPYLRVGSNAVHLEATSTNPSGGTLYLYIGKGGNQNGTVTLDKPDVSFGLSATRVGATSRDYTLAVQ